MGADGGAAVTKQIERIARMEAILDDARAKTDAFEAALGVGLDEVFRGVGEKDAES